MAPRSHLLAVAWLGIAFSSQTMSLPAHGRVHSQFIWVHVASRACKGFRWSLLLEVRPRWVIAGDFCGQKCRRRFCVVYPCRASLWVVLGRVRSIYCWRVAQKVGTWCLEGRVRCAVVSAIFPNPANRGDQLAGGSTKEGKQRRNVVRGVR